MNYEDIGTITLEEYNRIRESDVIALENAKKRENETKEGKIWVKIKGCWYRVKQANAEIAKNNILRSLEMG